MPLKDLEHACRTRFSRFELWGSEASWGLLKFGIRFRIPITENIMLWCLYWGPRLLKYNFLEHSAPEVGLKNGVRIARLCEYDLVYPSKTRTKFLGPRHIPQDSIVLSVLTPCRGPLHFKVLGGIRNKRDQFPTVLNIPLS